MIFIDQFCISKFNNNMIFMCIVIELKEFRLHIPYLILNPSSCL